MKLSSISGRSRRKSAVAMTLVEVVVTLAISGIVLVSVISLTIFTARGFAMMSNYVNLDQQSRLAVDKLGRIIRNASALTSYSNGSTTKSLTLKDDLSGTTTVITYDANAGTVITRATKSGVTTTTTNLTECDDWSFTLYNRAPDTGSFATNIVFYSTTNAEFCKMIDLSWKCSRKVQALKLNTESVQTAQIVLRNQVTY